MMVPSEVEDRYSNDGELRLWAAVIETALFDLIKQGSALSTAHDNADAEHWIFTPGCEFFNSFDNLCHILGLDPDAARDRIRGMMLRGETITTYSKMRKVLSHNRVNSKMKNSPKIDEESENSDD